MGLLGGLLLLGGLSAIGLGLLGAVLAIATGDLANLGMCVVLVGGGIVSGTLGAAVLE